VLCYSPEYCQGYSLDDLGTAIETPMKVTVRLTVQTDRPYTKTPHFVSHPASEPIGEYYCTTGVEADLRDATRSAVRHMIEYLCVTYNMGRVEAYMLCSIAGDLRLHEVVCLRHG
jgi:acetamidase/formamidase